MSYFYSNDVFNDNLKRTFNINEKVKSKILVVGLCSLGVDIAKNLACNGLSQIYLIDDNNISSDDIRNNIFYDNDSVDKVRNTILSKNLNELNSSIQIVSMRGDIDQELLNNSIVIIVNQFFESSVKINKLCRKSINCKMIIVTSFGVSGFIFVDADKHKCYPNGKDMVKSVQLHSINKDGLVRCAEHSRHNFKSGDEIYFTNLEGTNIDFLRNNWKVIVISDDFFQLDNFEGPEEEFKFLNGSCYLSIKKLDISHNTFEDSLDLLLLNDNDELKRVIEFYKLMENKDFNDPWSNITNDLVDGYDITGQKLLRSYNMYIPSVSNILSSYVSLEVLKLFSEFYNPINQWYIWSDVSIIPDKIPDNISSDRFYSLFGNKYDNLYNLNILLVGAGSLCSEWLNIFIKYEIAFNGKIKIVDNANVKEINFNRNFILKENDIGKNKAEVLCNRFKKYNNFTEYYPINSKITSNNSELFSDVDVVICTVNNIETCKLISEICFDKKLPLFISNINKLDIKLYPIIPYVTDLYTNIIGIQKETKYPLCLKESPNEIFHTIHYAANEFKFFKRFCYNLNFYKDNKNFYKDLPIYDQGKVKKDLKTFVIDNDFKSWKDCVLFAISMFNKEFIFDVNKILKSLPPDYKNSSGEKYWSGGKRCPKPLKLNLSCTDTIQFIEASAHLLCKCCCIDDNFTRVELVNFISNCEENKEFTGKVNDEELVLPDDLEVKKNFKYPSFDDGIDWRQKYICGYANCRAIVYNIQTISDFESKEIIDRINFADMDEIAEVNFNNIKTIDSISYSVGILSYELLKYVLNKDNRKNIYNITSVSLNNNNINSKIIDDSPNIKFNENFILNKWDTLEYNKDSTLSDFIEEYNKKSNMSVCMVCFGSENLYMEGFLTSNLDKNLYDILLEKGVNIKNIPANLNLLLEDEDNEDLDDDGIELNVKIFIG